MSFLKDMSLKSFSIRWIISSIILCCILNLFYSIGFLKYYNLDSMFIDFSLKDVRTIFIYILIGAIIFIAIAMIIKLLFQRISSVKAKKNERSILALILGIIFALLLVLNELDVNYPLGHIFGDYPTLPALLISFLLIIMKKNLRTLPILALAMFFSIALANHMGSINALHKENYLIIKEKEKNYAVLSNYNDTYIIAPVNLKTKVIENEFQLIDSNTKKLGDDATFDYENTGKLKTKAPTVIK
ncbi:hypothetical protein COJ90_21260 [Priestia megaterium]|uniref:hypothetical protein n=1 Tax=Priestia megaterium TaxID=1404 RepID=UPI000BF64A4C|nr:hypothetical protein [Priestia megaterium]PFP09244.1 hypothetical protein COJ90_21260 [Priestia megaterium]